MVDVFQENVSDLTETDKGAERMYFSLLYDHDHLTSCRCCCTEFNRRIKASNRLHYFLECEHTKDTVLWIDSVLHVLCCVDGALQLALLSSSISALVADVLECFSLDQKPALSCRSYDQSPPAVR